MRLMESPPPPPFFSFFFGVGGGVGVLLFLPCLLCICPVRSTEKIDKRGEGARVQLSCLLCVQFDMLVIRDWGVEMKFYVTLSGLLRCQCSVLAIRRGEGTVCQWQPWYVSIAELCEGFHYDIGSQLSCDSRVFLFFVLNHIYS